jgi:hypothetical protein
MRYSNLGESYEIKYKSEVQLVYDQFGPQNVLAPPMIVHQMLIHVAKLKFIVKTPPFLFT